MTILFFSRLFYPHIGGVEKHVLELSKQLIKKGHKIIVVTENHGWKEKEIVEGIEVFRIPVGKNEKQKKFVIWSWLMKNKRIIEQADIIHCHDVFFWYLPFRFAFPNKKVFVTFHGYEGNTIPGKKEIAMHKIAEKLSNGNICIGEFLTKWYHTTATAISYGAVAVLEKNVEKSPSKIPFHFLYIGRLEEEAGILSYIQALGILKQKGIVPKLTVLGDGSQRKQAEMLAKKLKINVVFTGFIKNVNEYLPYCDFVFVSRYLGILEAFAQKKLVFATYNNAIKKDYLTMTPFAKWMYIAENETELAMQISDELNHNHSKQIYVNEAFSWVKNQTWNKLSHEYLKLWMTS